MSENDREHGPQPLDELMEQLGASNHDLVAASPEQLTHKQVQRARKGRQLTANMQKKVFRAFSAMARQKGLRDSYRQTDLFNYQAD
ncbi:MAG: hypothetical protein AAF236_14225 [Verrucomicrobiota bacterium]